MTEWTDQQEANLALVMSGFVEAPPGYHPAIRTCRRRRSIRCCISSASASAKGATRIVSLTVHGSLRTVRRRAGGRGSPAAALPRPRGGGTAQSASPVRCRLVCRPASRSQRQPAAVSHSHRYRPRLSDGKAADDRRLPAVRQRLAEPPGRCVGRYCHSCLQRTCRDPPLPEIGICQQGDRAGRHHRRGRPLAGAETQRVARQACRLPGQIRLVRNRRNLGFVRSVNAGMEAAGDHDVVLLDSDTEVRPAG